MEGYTYPQMREQLRLYGVTNDAIGKIGLRYRACTIYLKLGNLR